MWRPRQSTWSYLAVALLIYGLVYSARNILLGPRRTSIIPPPIDTAPLFGPPEVATAPGVASTGPPLDGSDADTTCPEYGFYASVPHEPYSVGRFNLPFQRPVPPCRKVVLPEIEDVIESMRKSVKDPDLFRLFENCFPNTLDTSVTWTGVSSENRDEELTFITTGDIPAMWLRDSANQLQSYVALLKPSTNRTSLASLFRGAINLQARYIFASPHCNAFQPPLESGMGPSNDGSRTDFVVPSYDPTLVFECKYELDSLASFLQLSWDYYSRSKDESFFFRQAKTWRSAVVRILQVAEDLRQGTYAPDGMVPPSPYRFTRYSPVATETLPNGGNGSPVRSGTGLVRSAFRPSDDSCTFQFLVPANMMFSRYLGLCAEIMEKVEAEDDDGGARDVAKKMKKMAAEIKKGVEKYGRVKHPDLGEIYAYEVDGYWSNNMMDDANLPSLLGAPLMGYMSRTDKVYRATRKFILSTENPYYDHGPVINGTGGAHIGPGMAWPMSLIVAIMTSDDDDEIVDMLGQLLSSTDGLGLMHESVNVYNQAMWTRAWFSWANGLFGQMLLDLRERKPHLLEVNFQ